MYLNMPSTKLDMFTGENCPLDVISKKNFFHIQHFTRKIDPRFQFQ